MSTASALLDAYLPAFLSPTTLPLPTFLARVYPLALGAFLVIVSLGLFFAPASMANGVKMATPSPQTRGYMLLFAIREFSMGALFVAITLQGDFRAVKLCLLATVPLAVGDTWVMGAHSEQGWAAAFRTHGIALAVTTAAYMWLDA